MSEADILQHLQNRRGSQPALVDRGGQGLGQGGEQVGVDRALAGLPAGLGQHRLDPAGQGVPGVLGLRLEVGVAGGDPAEPPRRRQT
jgi:hypothetical protein